MMPDVIVLSSIFNSEISFKLGTLSDKLIDTELEAIQLIPILTDSEPFSSFNSILLLPETA